jgi:hypothetical protein
MQKNKLSMKTFLILLLLLTAVHSVAQTDWSKTSNWKIYRVPGPAVFKITIDSLNRLDSRPLQKDSLMSFLATCTILPDSINPLWMGGWVATYESTGKTHKLEISSYGAFFYDQSSGRFYQIPMALKDDWMTYINQVLSLL